MWPAPLNLISVKDHKFTLNYDVARKLNQIDKDLVIVCIAGPYRSGKSYLMNRLVDASCNLKSRATPKRTVEKCRQFAMGSTVESVTNGIWVWYIDHPQDRNKGLLLMDTEGLDDPARRDENYDTSILSLALLLSSIFVYNVVGRIDNRTYQTLQFIADISPHIRVSTSDETDANFDGVFPSFVLVIRDATLRLNIGGKDVNEDEYMEKTMLKQHSEDTNFDKKQNDVKKKLRRYFSVRKCFYFNRPSRDDDDLEILEKLDDSRLQEKFLKKSKEFCEYILNKPLPKKINRIQPVKGRMFVELVRNYLLALNKGCAPCVDTAVKEVAKKEEEFALKKSVEKYRESMFNSLTVPLNLDEFKVAHDRAHKVAFSVFFKIIFIEDAETCLAELRKLLYQEYAIVTKVNVKNSEKKCNRVLEKLFTPIKKNIERGTYAERKGYEHFLDDVDDLKRTYYSESKMGIMVDDVWKLFAVHTILREDERLYQKQNEFDAKIFKEKEKLRRESEENIPKRAFENGNRRREVQKEADIDKIISSRSQQQSEFFQQTHEVSLRNFEDKSLRKINELAQNFQRQLDARKSEHLRLVHENCKQDAKKLETEIECLTRTSEVTIKRLLQILSRIGFSVATMMTNSSNPILIALGIAIAAGSAAVAVIK